AQQQTQLRDNNSLKSDLALLQERLKSLNKQLEKQPAANNRNDNSKEIDRLRAEINAQKRLIETSSNGRSDAEVLALQSKVKSLEAQNAQFLLLMQNNDSSNDSMVIKKVVIDTIRIAEQNATNPDTSLMLLVEQMAEMEKQLAEKNKMSSENKNAQSELVKTLQDRITQLEAELKKKPTPAPPIVKVIPAPIPEKAPIEEFITKHRQENVYFDNGSYNLNSLQREKVATIATWLDTYELLDINVKGFASNVGSRTVNERISRKRAQSVKETLVKMGVAGDRIIIQPLGIDATSTDPANARRAEIHLFVRGM
ncbi:MAG: OmpA family protein, partial [Saprospiraceae bacterium]